MEINETQAIKKTTPALELIWGQYRMWDLTAYVSMSGIRTWRQRVLYLTISGAFFGVLSGIVSSYLPISLYAQHPVLEHIIGYVSQVLAIISTICISLGAYAGGQVLSEEKEKSAIKSRALAESYKSEAYQYIFKAGEYKKDPEDNAFKAVEKLIKDFAGLEALSLKKADELIDIPEMDYSIETYVKTRVEDQIYGYYNKKVTQFQEKITKYNKIIFVLGFFGVIFGSFGAAGYAKYTSVWIAFIASASAALGSFVATNRFQQTILTYQASSNRLKTILSKWQSHPTKDQHAIADFVEDIEEELMRENKAWVEESTKKLKPEDDLTQVAQGLKDEAMKELEAKYSPKEAGEKKAETKEHHEEHKSKEKHSTKAKHTETKKEEKEVEKLEPTEPTTPVVQANTPTSEGETEEDKEEENKEENKG